ncbi:ornithine carbamoyltransferase [Streptomyces iconiensis]|uniref:Ornithine carbamoyltransferase n=1 Tax=Streptomyces iconiensis TaxID=1384038 RepID=A0ABT7A5X3_9ACTN|nr:ornithine carbamoyltransferase [Streptomyces iconiensis]MDJ1136018.1 ornithine carbamoyltransferase [Streptomyces iconiensis]
MWQRRRHLLSIADLTDAELHHLVEAASGHAAAAAEGTAPASPLRGLVVGTYFRKTSTRTRTAFSAAALRLGAQVIAFGPADLQENTGESVEDTGRVLSRMLDGLVVRTSGPDKEIAAYAAQERMSVVNAMSEGEHPTQALADLTTVHRVRGRIDGARVLYVGEGNNSAVALALALTRFPGTELHVVTPPGYGLPEATQRAAQKYAAASGSTFTHGHDLAAAPENTDFVYTTRWQTTGTTKPDPDWRTVFEPFRVDEALMARHPAAAFLHDLPAHRGEEVSAAVLDGPAGIAFDQAENKMHSAAAVLEWCLTGG